MFFIRKTRVLTFVYSIYMKNKAKVMSELSKKLKFIKSWYIHECSKLDFNNKLKLANIWILICINDEEYEMAAILKTERANIIQEHIKTKRRSRAVSQKFFIRFLLIKRIIRKFLRNTLSKWFS